MSDKVSGHKVKNKKKRNNKQSDAGCWNCFTSEDGDNDVVDVEPIPLPKVREEHREKLKVYSFLASELSKPKAVSLKQKISEPYKIGKRIDAEILKQQSNIPVSVSEELNSAESSYNQESHLNMLNTVNYCNSQINCNNFVPKSNVHNCSEPRIKQFSNPNTPLVTPRTRRKIKALDISGVSYVFPQDEPNLSESIPRIDKKSQIILEMKKPTQYHTASTYSIEKSVEGKSRSEELYDATAILNKRKEIETFTPSSIRKPVENENVWKKYHSFTDIASLRTSSLQKKSRSVMPISKAISDELKPIDEKKENVKYYNSIVFETKELKKFNPPPLQKMVENKNIANELKPHIKNVSSITESTNYDNLIAEATLSLSQLQISNKQSQNNIPAIKRSEELNKNYLNTDQSKQSSVSPTAFLKSTQCNLPAKGIDFEKKFASHGDISINAFTDGDKIVHKVHIATSTPKEKGGVVNKVHEDIIKSDLNMSVTREENMINNDKTDNTSSNGSESGYTGSLATVQEFVIDENQEESEGIEKGEKDFKDTIDKTLTSSLSSLHTVNKKLPMHSSSLSSGMNNLGKKQPTKSLRWSTLSKVPRSVSFEGTYFFV